jgi:hypothetical protein
VLGDALKGSDRRLIITSGTGVVGKSPDEAATHFGFLAHFAAGDLRASSARTQELLGWHARQVRLVADLEGGRYFQA